MKKCTLHSRVFHTTFFVIKIGKFLFKNYFGHILIIFIFWITMFMLMSPLCIWSFWFPLIMFKNRCIGKISCSLSIFFWDFNSEFKETFSSLWPLWQNISPKVCIFWPLSELGYFYLITFCTTFAWVCYANLC